jgi:hypothetical protein
MKTQTIYLTSTLLLVSSSLATANSAADKLKLRYANPAANAQLTVKHEIRAGQHNTTASREFDIDLEFPTSTEAVPVTITKAKANYTAHGMNQRLPTTKLIGQSVMLSIADEGNAIQRSKPIQDLEIPVGDIIGADYPVGLALTDMLPILPESPVAVGTTWSTTRPTLSLEGWAWASGTLSTEHRVTAIDMDNGHAIVSVSSTAKGQLGEAEKGLKFSGDGTLSRTSNWRFDSTDGRLLALSMKQTTSGINTLPQGEVEVRQLTQVEFTTAP